MNPGYSGRSRLPDNLKKLFRNIAMSEPDTALIAQVTFYSQGFNHAGDLVARVLPAIEDCKSRLSKQGHYDFGLRALKSILVTCGRIKREKLANTASDMTMAYASEAEVVLRSLRETIQPKLVGNDSDIFLDILGRRFASVGYVPAIFPALQTSILQIAQTSNLLITEEWMAKALQLHQVSLLHHGIMLVGPTGAGKSSTWSTLATASASATGYSTSTYTIDAKVMSKAALYGKLDPVTREWTDGLFTSMLRKIIENLRGEEKTQHWIVFDGEVDPDWVENLNR